jgi:hypothetical protein
MQVGMRTREEEVRVNFGGQPFKADLPGLQRAYARSVLAGLYSTRVPASFSPAPAAGAAGEAQQQQQQQQQQQALGARLLFDHLVHSRHWRAAAAVARDVLGGAVEFGPEQVRQGGGGWDACAAAATAAAVSAWGRRVEQVPLRGLQGSVRRDRSARSWHCCAAQGRPDGARSLGLVASPLHQVEEVHARQAIYDAVAAGHVGQALAQLQQRHGAALLAARPRLLFRLKVQQFVELLRPGGAGPEAALLYGRSELGPAARGAAEEELFIDALSLLAYGEPAASPAGHLMQQRHRQQLAERVNDAIVAACGRPGAAAAAAAAAAAGEGAEDEEPCGSGSALERLYRQGAAAVEVLRQLGDLAACEVDPQQLCLEGL